MVVLLPTPLARGDSDDVPDLVHGFEVRLHRLSRDGPLQVQFHRLDAQGFPEMLAEGRHQVAAEAVRRDAEPQGHPGPVAVPFGGNDLAYGDQGPVEDRVMVGRDGGEKLFVHRVGSASGSVRGGYRLARDCISAGQASQGDRPGARRQEIPGM